LSTWDNALAGLSLEIDIFVFGLNNQCLLSSLEKATINLFEKKLNFDFNP
jgi:hypothetical protein